MEPYFYIIRHKSGMLYAGSRWNRKAKQNELLAEDGYHTSSKVVKGMIAEDGLDSFKVELIIPQSYLSIPVLEYETAFLVANNCAGSPLWLNKNNNAGPKAKEHKANMKGRSGTWKRREKDIEHLRRLMTKTNTEKNAMNNPESRAKVAAARIGRKRIYQPDGSFVMSPRMG